MAVSTGEQIRRNLEAMQAQVELTNMLAFEDVVREKMARIDQFACAVLSRSGPSYSFKADAEFAWQQALEMERQRAETVDAVRQQIYRNTSPPRQV